MRFVILMVCCGAFLAINPPGYAIQQLSTPRIVNTSQIVRATKAMRIGEHVFLVASTESAYAQEKIAQYCGKKEEVLVAEK